MHKMISRFPVWLLLLGYLLMGFSGIAAVAAAEEKPSPCVPAGAGEGCTECCAPESSPSHLRSTPASKRLLQAPLLCSNPRVAVPPSFAPPISPELRHSFLPNPTLAALRTVVLLN
jgi:hypothetical protein